MGYTYKTNTVKILLNSIIVLALIFAYFFFKQIQKEYDAITDFDSCVDAGYEVIATYPEECKIPGKTFVNTNQIKEQDKKSEQSSLVVAERNMNPKNCSYDIEGDHVLLQNGTWNSPVSSSTTEKKTVNYFGNELRTDINGDGKEDTVFIVTETTGGSGTFFYVVAALNKDGGYIGTNGILLGDRIAPQTTEWRNDEIVINYADRNPGEPMSKKPSVGVSRYFKIENDTLTETQK